MASRDFPALGAKFDHFPKFLPLYCHSGFVRRSRQKVALTLFGTDLFAQLLICEFLHRLIAPASNEIGDGDGYGLLGRGGGEIRQHRLGKFRHSPLNHRFG